jgi:HD-like signal output (HDOD) protein
MGGVSSRTLSSGAPRYQSAGGSTPPSGTVSADDVRGAALKFLAALAAEVSSGTVDLPCFPDIVLRIRKALADPKNTPEQTVTLVGAEPRLAGRLLQTANSAAFNPGGRPLTDLRTAITRLGHQLVQSAAMAFAMQHLKDEASLRSIAVPLNELWTESIAVASLCQIVAKRTEVAPDEAFLTGLLHGIGRLYVMVRAVARSGEFGDPASFLDLVSGWHPSIGRAVLESWGFAAEISEAVGAQADCEREAAGQAGLTDVLIVSIALGEALQMPAPRRLDRAGSAVFAAVGLSQEDCTCILMQAEVQLASLRDALGG